MRAVLGLTVLAAALIALAWWVAGLPGTISATVGETTMQTSAPVALVLLSVLFVVLYFAVRLLSGLFRLPRWSRRRRARRDRVQGDRAVTRTLVALAASDPAVAQREADRSRRLLGDTPLTMLLTAQAQRQAGREEDATTMFRALAERKDARFLGLRGLLRQATAREDWAGATEIARQAEAARPGALWLREERKFLALRTEQWAEALRLSGPENRATLAVAAAGTERNPAAAMRLAKQAWTADPTLAPAAIAYAKLLRNAGKGSKANDILRRSWAKQPHPEVAAEYLATVSDKQARLRAADSLALQNAQHPESRLLQAQASLDAGRIQDARRHIDAVRESGLNQRRVWGLLAEIADQQGHASEAQDALRNMVMADPDPVWRCGACGTVHEAWKPVCDACGTPGKIAWVQFEHSMVVRQIPLLDHARDAEGVTQP